MNAQDAPKRIRALATWLMSQSSMTGQQLVGQRLALAGAHRSHFSMLATLDEFGPMSQATLGRRSGLDRSDVAAYVATLEARGLIDRAPDPLDRRRNVVRITEAGGRHLRALEDLLAAAHDELLSPLSAKEREELVRLLTRLVEHHTSPAPPLPPADPAGGG